MTKKPVMPNELKNLLSGVKNNEVKDYSAEDTKTSEKPKNELIQKENLKEGRGISVKTTDMGSFDRIISYAQEYKETDTPMTSVVLSEDMKQLLDRLRMSLPVKVPLKYLLSGIIKEYFETHKQEITNLIVKF